VKALLAAVCVEVQPAQQQQQQQPLVRNQSVDETINIK